ncbi:hypothetical protein NFI96_021566 [Prochilodus magdalenae]|nr:hypothetical protein NFI96_021566 [Prochilodus magdalenae]
METDPVFKTPVKRKKGRVRSAASKQAKQGERGDDTDTDDGQSDSGWSMSSQEDTSSTVYTADEIKAFLQRTKGQKLVQVTGCISDWSQLVHDVGHFRRKAFTELELYRLKKLLTRLRKESTDDGHARLAFLDTLHSVVQNSDVNDLLVLGGDFNCTADDIDRNHMEPHPCCKSLWIRASAKCLKLSYLPCGFYRSLLRVKTQRAYWHFNTALLDDANFRESFIFFWDTFRLQKPSFNSVLQWWDLAKIQTKVFCQQYTLNVTRDIARPLKALKMEIVELHLGGNLGATMGNREHTETLKRKTATLAAGCQGIGCTGSLTLSECV